MLLQRFSGAEAADEAAGPSIGAQGTFGFDTFGTKNSRTASGLTLQKNFQQSNSFLASIVPHTPHGIVIECLALFDIYQRLLEIKKIFPIMYGHYGFRSLMLDYLFGTMKLQSDGTSKTLKFFKVYKSKSKVDTCEK